MAVGWLGLLCFHHEDEDAYAYDDDDGDDDDAPHHVDDLLEGEAEGEHHGLRLVGDGPLELVVVGEQVVQQLALVDAAVGAWGSHVRRSQRRIGCCYTWNTRR